MGQINARLRSIEGHHFSHWCDGCQCMHGIPLGWTFDGNLDAPTVAPSLNITGWAEGKAIGGRDGGTCHYNIDAGIVSFHGDTTHALAGQKVPLPDLPTWHRDDWNPT